MTKKPTTTLKKKRKTKSKHKAKSHAGVHKLRASGGSKPATNSFSFALPTVAPLGVPNFFIDSFQIPPFLLPIYQAAGIEYDVPWQVLAAINEIETDFGRNLSVSSAGAEGWMQFEPSTWKKYGVDATGNGYADPYNPVDAIFAAGRYLQAAGAATNLEKAIFAYNHAHWYVQSVLLRAQLIGGMPAKLISALTGLVQGHFPVAAASRYADDDVERLTTRRIHRANAAIALTSDPTSTGTTIYAKKGSPVIAVNDGKIIKVGHNKTLGRYIKLQDATGNTYTYADLGSIPRFYPVPKPVRITARDIARELRVVRAPLVVPTQAATAGTQTTAATSATTSATGPFALHLSSATPTTVAATPATVRPKRRAARSVPAPAKATVTALVKERLFADPTRPASYAAGGREQVNSGFEISRFQNYFSDVLHLARNQYKLEPLKAGSIVVSGTILGRIAAKTKTSASHLYFMIQPAGRKAPYIDPKVILDGWKLLAATSVYRAAGIDPFLGRGAAKATIGQILLESKAQLQARVLVDRHASIYACGRRDIESGLIDRRILATIEFLTTSGLDPTITGLDCGATKHGTNGIDQTGATGDSMDISAINGIPILGNQGPGSITDITIRRLLTLQATQAPSDIISLMSYKGQPTTLSLPDHGNRIQITYAPSYGQNKKLSAETQSLLKPRQWIKLIQRISQIPEPTVSLSPSRAAVKTSVQG